MKKFLIFGDSIMKGVMYNGETGRYSLAKDRKNELFSNAGIFFDNYSRMGATVEKGLDTVEKCIDVLDSDTVVLLEYGGNDCDHRWQEISDDPDGKHLPVVDPEKFTRLYGELIELIKSRGAQVVVSTLYPLAPKTYFKWITLGRNSDNILKWLGDVDILYRWQEYYNLLAMSVASRYGCRIFDLRSSIGVDHGFADLVGADGIHPTAKGHSLISDMLYGFAVTHDAPSLAGIALAAENI